MQLKELLSELSIIEESISHLAKNPIKSNELLSENSSYRELICSHFKTHPCKINEWINTPIEESSFHKENLIHKTLAGHMVRSKSEVIIANALFLNHIPYRYEAPLHLESGETIYPDFDALNTRTSEEFYWEHMGMMDDENYSSNAYDKLKTYGHNNYFPGINLITTFETSTIPIDSNKIQQIIEQFLL